MTEREFKYDYLSLHARDWIAREQVKYGTSFWQEISNTINVIVETLNTEQVSDMKK